MTMVGYIVVNELQKAWSKNFMRNRKVVRKDERPVENKGRISATREVAK